MDISILIDDRYLKELCMDWFHDHGLCLAEPFLLIYCGLDPKCNGYKLDCNIKYGSYKSGITLVLMAHDFEGYSKDAFTFKLHEKLKETIYKDIEAQTLYISGHMHLGEVDIKKTPMGTFDALIEAGFSKKEAMDMVMKLLENK